MTKEIIVYHITGDAIRNSLGEVCNQGPYLDWLVAHEEVDRVHMFYHLDWAVANLCRMIQLDNSEIKKLWDNKQLYVRGSSSNYTLRYVPGKMFSIDRGAGIGHTFMMFGDMQQYREFDIEDWEVEKGSIVGIAEQALTAISEITGVEPNNLVSPIRAYQKAVLEKMDLPTDDDIEVELGALAYGCCKGGWTEGFAKGQWEMVYDWDINSAYPWQAMQLIDIRNGVWEYSRGFAEDKAQEIGAMGFYNCVVDMEAGFHPILYIDGRDRSFTPTGIWKTCLTLDEIMFIRAWGLGQVRVIDGYSFVPRKGARHPLQGVIKKLYEYRQEHSGLESAIAKRIMVGIYGKFLEVLRVKEEKFGPLYNTVWAAQIETRTRLAVAKFALDNGIVPLHIAVDGLVTDVELDRDSNNEIGKWKLGVTGPALVIGSGAVAIQGKVGEGDFSLDYDWLRERIEVDGEGSRIEMQADSIVTVGKAVAQSKYDLIGTVEKGSRSVELYGDIKRDYEEVGSFNGLLGRQYGSSAWDTSIVGWRKG